MWGGTGGDDGEGRGQWGGGLVGLAIVADVSCLEGLWGLVEVRG